MFDYKTTMDSLVESEVAQGRVKGASALVLHRGKELYFGAFGDADAERGIPMGRDTIIRLYSMTKPVTAAAVMILAERGDIDLWDPVSKYLPCFRGQTVWTGGGEVPVQRENTIYDLLNMTSGITYPDQAHEPGRRMQAVVEENVRRGGRESGWIPGSICGGSPPCRSVSSRGRDGCTVFPPTCWGASSRRRRE